MTYIDIEKERAAKRRYYDSHREVYLNKNRRKKEPLRDIMREHKSKPCADCGQQFPFYVMDFDHREGEEKLAHVSRLVQRMNLQKLLMKLRNAMSFVLIVTEFAPTTANKDFPG